MGWRTSLRTRLARWLLRSQGGRYAPSYRELFVTVAQGKRGNWRWYAYIWNHDTPPAEERLICQGPVRGYSTAHHAEHAAYDTLGATTPLRFRRVPYKPPAVRRVPAK